MSEPLDEETIAVLRRGVKMNRISLDEEAWSDFVQAIDRPVLDGSMRDLLESSPTWKEPRGEAGQGSCR